MNKQQIIDRKLSYTEVINDFHNVQKEMNRKNSLINKTEKDLNNVSISYIKQDDNYTSYISRVRIFHDSITIPYQKPPLLLIESEERKRIEKVNLLSTQLEKIQRNKTLASNKIKQRATPLWKFNSKSNANIYYKKEIKRILCKSNTEVVKKSSPRRIQKIRRIEIFVQSPRRKEKERHKWIDKKFEVLDEKVSAEQCGSNRIELIKE